MAKLMKNSGKKVNAYELGANTPMEDMMLREGKIVLEDGVYYLRSTEVVNAGTKGQEAHAGDFFKVDGEGNPYPNGRDWFLEHHKIIDAPNGVYEQIPQPNEAWFVGEPVTDAVQFAVDHELVKLDPENPEQFFGAHLWGEWLTAPSTAALMFYSISRNRVGIVTAVDFNFVIESEIQQNYHIVS